METYCSECGKAHEVGESQKNAYMFCLGCDKFFKVEEKSKTPKKDDVEEVVEENTENINKAKKSLNKKQRSTLKKFFVLENTKSKPVLSETELEADLPKMDEGKLLAAEKSFALIDDFLDPESDFEDQMEDVPAEYIDFLSIGLDISSSDLIEHHAKNKSDEPPPQKEQE